MYEIADSPSRLAAEAQGGRRRRSASPLPLEELPDPSNSPESEADLPREHREPRDPDDLASIADFDSIAPYPPLDPAGERPEEDDPYLVSTPPTPTGGPDDPTASGRSLRELMMGQDWERYRKDREARQRAESREAVKLRRKPPPPPDIRDPSVGRGVLRPPPPAGPKPGVMRRLRPIVPREPGAVHWTCLAAALLVGVAVTHVLLRSAPDRPMSEAALAAVALAGEQGVDVSLGDGLPGTIAFARDLGDAWLRAIAPMAAALLAVASFLLARFLGGSLFALAAAATTGACAVALRPTLDGVVPGLAFATLATWATLAWWRGGNPLWVLAVAAATAVAAWFEPRLLAVALVPALAAVLAIEWRRPLASLACCGWLVLMVAMPLVAMAWLDPSRLPTWPSPAWPAGLSLEGPFVLLVPMGLVGALGLIARRPLVGMVVGIWATALLAAGGWTGATAPLAFAAAASAAACFAVWRTFSNPREDASNRALLVWRHAAGATLGMLVFAPAFALAAATPVPEAYAADRDAAQLVTTVEPLLPPRATVWVDGADGLARGLSVWTGADAGPLPEDSAAALRAAAREGRPVYLLADADATEAFERDVVSGIANVRLSAVGTTDALATDSWRLSVID